MQKNKAIALLTTALLVLSAFSGYLAIRAARLERQVSADRGVVFDECKEGPACPVSLYELLVHPYRYDGMRIRVTGVYLSGFESSVLSPAMPGAGDALEPKSAIWLDGNIAGVTSGDPATTFIGTFHAGPKGHLGQYPGALVVE